MGDHTKLQPHSILRFFYEIYNFFFCKYFFRLGVKPDFWKLHGKKYDFINFEDKGVISNILKIGPNTDLNILKNHYLIESE
jgi:hypothetical protein